MKTSLYISSSPTVWFSLCPIWWHLDSECVDKDWFLLLKFIERDVRLAQHGYGTCISYLYRCVLWTQWLWNHCYVLASGYLVVSQQLEPFPSVCICWNAGWGEMSHSIQLFLWLLKWEMYDHWIQKFQRWKRADNASSYMWAKYYMSKCSSCPWGVSSSRRGDMSRDKCNMMSIVIGVL